MRCWVILKTVNYFLVNLVPLWITNYCEDSIEILLAES